MYSTYAGGILIAEEEAGVTDLRMVSPPPVAPSGAVAAAAFEMHQRDHFSPLQSPGFSESQAEGQPESDDVLEQDVVLEEEAAPSAEGQLIDYPSQDPLQFLDELELVDDAEHQARGESPPHGAVDYDPDENEPHDFEVRL